MGKGRSKESSCVPCWFYMRKSLGKEDPVIGTSLIVSGKGADRGTVIIGFVLVVCKEWRAGHSVANDEGF
jgi:hypothetical protein